MKTRFGRVRAAVVVLLAMALTGVSVVAVSAASAPAPAAPAATAATAAGAPVTVSGSAVGPPLPAGFVGVATEYWDVEKEVGDDPAKPDVAFEQALRNLAPSGGFSLRIGGDSADWSWWPIPGMKQPVWVRFTITPAWAAVTKRLVDDLHAHLIVGINMEANSPRIATAEVRGIRSAIGGSVPTTFELGNEPELYSHFPFYRGKHGQPVLGRPAGYSYADITSQWDQLAGALGHVRLAGPGYSSLGALPYAGQFLGAMHRLSLLTVHTYPLKSKRCSGGADLQESALFDPDSLQTMADELGSWVSLARRYGVTVRVDEMNSVTCGGSPQFSGTFGPSLWALNILPLYAQVGAGGVNFQTKPYTAQDLIQTTDTHAGWRTQVQPEYYGLLAFAQLTPPGSSILRVSAVPDGLYAWAVRTPQGQTHVVVTNVTAGARTVAVRATGASGPAAVESLTAGAGGLRASGGVTLGGQRISSVTGQLTGTPVRTTVHSSRGVYEVTVAPTSAAIVTFKR